MLWKGWPHLANRPTWQTATLVKHSHFATCSVWSLVRRICGNVCGLVIARALRGIRRALWAHYLALTLISIDCNWQYLSVAGARKAPAAAPARRKSQRCPLPTPVHTMAATSAACTAPSHSFACLQPAAGLCTSWAIWPRVVQNKPDSPPEEAGGGGCTRAQGKASTHPLKANKLNKLCGPNLRKTEIV